MEIKFALIPNLFASSHPHFTSLLQLFPQHHAVSSPVLTKPRLYWNGVTLVTWVAGKTSSTTSSVRSACLSGECARGVTTTWTSHRATWAWPSAALPSVTYKPTPSTASRSRRSMVFLTRAPTRLSSPRWTSPQIRLVGAAAASWLTCQRSILNL